MLSLPFYCYFGYFVWLWAEECEVLMASEQGCLSSFKRQSKNPKALLPKPTQHNTDVTSATARQFPLSESKSTLSSPPCLWGVYSQRPLITYCFDPPHPPVSIPEHFMRYSNFSFWLVTITPSEFHISPPWATSYFPLSAVTEDVCTFTASLNANKAKVLIVWCTNTPMHKGES